MIITAICGHAIGSSFIIGHNVEKILKPFNFLTLKPRKLT